MHEAKLRYSEPLLREVVRAFVIRRLLRRLGASFFIVLALLVAALAWFNSRGHTGWFVGFLAATVLFVLAFFAMVYVAHFRNTIGRFRQMGTPEATLSYDEQQICFTSELGSSAMPWSVITEVWRCPGSGSSCSRHRNSSPCRSTASMSGRRLSSRARPTNRTSNEAMQRTRCAGR